MNRHVSRGIFLMGVAALVASFHTAQTGCNGGGGGGSSAVASTPPQAGGFIGKLYENGGANAAIVANAAGQLLTQRDFTPTNPTDVVTYIRIEGPFNWAVSSSGNYMVAELLDINNFWPTVGYAVIQSITIQLTGPTTTWGATFSLQNQAVGGNINTPNSFPAPVYRVRVRVWTNASWYGTLPSHVMKVAVLEGMTQELNSSHIN